MSEETTTTATLTTVLDTVGRTILGETVSEKTTDKILALKNPVVLNVVPQDQSGRMSVQLLPIFFREFLPDKTGDVVFLYKRDNITEADIDAIDFRLQAQYNQMFNKSNLFVPAGGSAGAPAGGVVNLFDE
jgi:hypothetical protein